MFGEASAARNSFLASKTSPGIPSSGEISPGEAKPKPPSSLPPRAPSSSLSSSGGIALASPNGVGRLGSKNLLPVREDDPLGGDGHGATAGPSTADGRPSTAAPLPSSHDSSSKSDGQAVARPSSVTIVTNVSSGSGGGGGGQAGQGSAVIVPSASASPFLLQLPPAGGPSQQQAMTSKQSTEGLTSGLDHAASLSSGKASLWFTSDDEPYVTGVKAFRTGVFRFKGNNDDIHMVYLVTEMLEKRK